MFILLTTPKGPLFLVVVSIFSERKIYYLYVPTKESVLLIVYENVTYTIVFPQRLFVSNYLSIVLLFGKDQNSGGIYLGRELD